MTQVDFDLFIIGGGVNGVGIARDAAGRGLRVGLAEQGDLASATSSASTKLFHGGLRYLEYFELRMVRDALIERERLLSAMPHISWPMRFILPLHSQMRFEGDTPTSGMLAFLMPWSKGRRPAWIIRFGLFLYDHIGGRKILPPTKTLRLQNSVEGAALQEKYKCAYEYSDCWVDDARLVVLNAVDAARLGARIFTRTRVMQAERVGDLWHIELHTQAGRKTVTARALVNAAGPWAENVISSVLRDNTAKHLRLVRGSHIVTKRLFGHDKCYFFQGADGRIIFAIPYEEDFTLIGTTDAEHESMNTPPECSAAEQAYLINFANQYFKHPISAADVIWTYAGVRPLYDDGAQNAQGTTRDYTLSLNTAGPPLLSVFGGKITTYRKLAEQVLHDLAPHLPMRAPWTAGAALPGGDFAVHDVPLLIKELQNDYPFLSAKWARRLVRAYGTSAAQMLADARNLDDLGQNFGANLTECEVQWLIQNEFAQTADDILWRRSKLGLRLTKEQVQGLERYLQSCSSANETS